MIVTLTIKDDVYQRYVEHNPTNPRLAMEQTLERFKEHGTRKAATVLPLEVVRELKTILGSAVEDPKKLLEWVKRASSLTVEGQEVVLKGGQRQRLEAEAKFYKKEFGPHVKTFVEDRLAERLGRS